MADSTPSDELLVGDASAIAQTKTEIIEGGFFSGAGLTIEKGIRRSTRVRVRPLQWWRNESYDWERLHDSKSSA